MTQDHILQALSKIFIRHFQAPPLKITPLAPSGSPRRYYRLQSSGSSAIGTYNEDDRENHAFLAFSHHFRSKGLPVPEIYAEDLPHHVYLQEDLGEERLYDRLPAPGAAFSEELTQLYQRVVEQLARLQIVGGAGLDYSLCTPREVFDERAMMWDFNAFKYQFLKLSGVVFDEEALEEEGQQLIKFLAAAGAEHFLFRDFQSRNIMLRDGEPYFIDYQGGRRGALPYDLASLLYQAKANIPEAVREELLHHYLDAAEQYTAIDRAAFIRHYYGFVLLRTLQVLGAYGLRGLYERKPHFLQSIPYALQNLNNLLRENRADLQLPELRRLVGRLLEDERFAASAKKAGAQRPLVVRIHSFSYKIGGIPPDPSGNGGGFVFDCRFLHNPGRYAPYKKLTGRDEAVINFLKHHSQMDVFLGEVFRIVDEAVDNYIERGFTSLMVSFGCTGGQHRSVYAADELAKHLQERYGVNIELQHVEQERKNWKNE